LKPTSQIGIWIITAGVTATFAGVMILLLLRPIAISGEAGDILKILAGILGAKFGDVIGYHVNSSAGSKAKDGIIAGQMQQQPPSPA
jgi:hypothetical protein